FKDNGTGVNSKPKGHVTIRQAVLEEIGNRNTKVPVPPTKTANVNKHLKPTASVKPVQMEDISMKEENLCQAFSDALLCKIEDIDTEDWENPQLCSDYMKDIYQYLRQFEAILVDWLVQGHSKFRLLQEMLYMCVAIMDRYLQFSPNIKDFVYITDNAYTSSQIREMSMLNSTLQALSFTLQLTLTNYDMVHYHPPKQQYYTGYIENEVMRHMAKNIRRVNKNMTSSKLLKISTIPQLNSKAIQELASPLLGQP
ncbi:hypothetical protein FD755_001117, partial [Muntiacus reevesi]